MPKKKHDTLLSRRFNSGDIEKWQELANNETGGNLTLLIELTMNKDVERTKYLRRSEFENDKVHTEKFT